MSDEKQRKRFILGAMLIGLSFGVVIGALGTYATGRFELVAFAAVLSGVTTILAPSYRDVFR